MTQPENTVPSVPQSVAEEDSVRAANESIREMLLEQSGRTRDDDEEDRRGTAADEPTSEPAARRGTRKTDGD